VTGPETDFEKLAGTAKSILRAKSGVAFLNLYFPLTQGAVRDKSPDREGQQAGRRTFGKRAGRPLYLDIPHAQAENSSGRLEPPSFLRHLSRRARAHVAGKTAKNCGRPETKPIAKMQQEAGDRGRNPSSSA